ncbi:MAG: GMC family oxidoreductase N-terminal domain-containing protein, partial [Leptospirales bacterium]
MTSADFDVIIAGSGFGGSVLAARLSEAGLNILLLERGNAWAPGSFPRFPREFHQALWDPSRNRYGLYNLWSFPGIDIVTASGLGGGSLLYANVLLRKDPAWFSQNQDENWPISYEDLVPHYERVEQTLGARHLPSKFLDFAVPKSREFRDAAKAAGLDWRTVPLAVSFGKSADAAPETGVPLSNMANLHGAPRVSCRLCGECDVGCNYGSKNTLDLNYLSAAKANGTDIRTLSQVVSIRPEHNGYVFGFVTHDPN